jgi:hypothetical protein
LGVGRSPSIHRDPYKHRGSVGLNMTLLETPIYPIGLAIYSRSRPNCDETGDAGRGLRNTENDLSSAVYGRYGLDRPRQWTCLRLFLKQSTVTRMVDFELRERCQRFGDASKIPQAPRNALSQFRGRIEGVYANALYPLCCRD